MESVPVRSHQVSSVCVACAVTCRVAAEFWVRCAQGSAYTYQCIRNGQSIASMCASEAAYFILEGVRPRPKVNFMAVAGDAALIRDS